MVLEVSMVERCHEELTKSVSRTIMMETPKVLQQVFKTRASSDQVAEAVYYEMVSVKPSIHS
jgi:hypothetical protein